MIAVFVNMLTVLLGSVIGIFFRKKIKNEYIDAIISALALITITIGTTSAIATENVICLIVCLVLGTALGVLIKLDKRIDGAGDWLKARLFRSKGAEGRFTEGFVSACIMFCIGSMTIMGSFEAGINDNYNIIFAKSALDFVSSMMLGAAMGVGVTCSVVFILIFQGGLTLLSSVISPYLGASVVTEMSAVGGAVLMGMGINLLELSNKKIRVACMLPAVFLPIAYIPLAELIEKLI